MPLKTLLLAALLSLSASAQTVISGPFTSSGPGSVSTVAPTTPACQIVTPSLVPNTVATGSALTTAAVVTQNCVSPLTWSLASGSLSGSGLSLNTSTSVISGTGGTVATYTFTLHVVDANSNSATSPTYSISVTATSLVGDNACENSSGTWTCPATDGPANAPFTAFYTARSSMPSPGATVNVTSGSCASLQAAFSGATAGETIVIPVALYDSCPLTASANGNASNWITVVTAASASLPAEGTRISPAYMGVTSLTGRPAYAQPTVAGNYLPKIRANISNGTPTLTVGGSYWHFLGEDFTSAQATDGFQVIVVNGASHIVFDQDLINGADTNQLRNGIQAGIRITSGDHLAVVGSYIYNIGCINGNALCSGDSQGIFVCGSSTACSTLKFVNNFIEAGGENIFSGGGGIGSSTQPATDVEIRKNHFFKPLWMKANDPSYLGLNFRVKNLMEWKNAVRVYARGNIFQNNWEGQSDQHGIGILGDSRNQNISYSGTATTAGSTVTWASGTQFMANIVSPSCATPNHCFITLNGSPQQFAVQSFISSTQITVLPIPPSYLSPVSFTASEPGLNPNAQLTDFILLNNYLTGMANGIQISNPLSDNGDPSESNLRFAIDNNAGDDIDGARWVTNADCCSYGAGFEIQNYQTGLAALDQIYSVHNTFLGTYSTGGNTGVAGSFGFGTATSGAIAHVTIRDNISPGGWWSGTANACSTGTQARNYWTCWVPAAGLCFGNNLFSTATLGTGTGSYTHDNPAYPSGSDNGACPTLHALSNVANFAAFQFTSLNNAIGGNYQLLSGSPGHSAASDGGDIGVNWTNLQNDIAGVQ